MGFGGLILGYGERGWGIVIILFLGDCGAGEGAGRG